ncbi:MAG: replication-relaxation family protein [Planctomycetaceae bacterium]|nr:replication-relaxation family protein [Planctomycetaceae bacterium]
MVTDRDIAIVQALANYYVLSRPQVQRLCFESDVSGRVTRRRLQLLVDARLINRQQMLFCAPHGGTPTTVYFPAPLGNELLAKHFDDDRHLLTPTLTPIQHHIPHWIAVAETHIAFDQSLNGQSDLSIEPWVNEWDVVNKDETAPERRFRLYRLITETPKLVCAPDAGFVLNARGHRKVFFLEQDRATSGVKQVADGKSRGYAAMAERRLHRVMFPEATVEGFNVLCITPDRKRRDALRLAMNNRPGSELWRFAAADDLENDPFHQPIFYPCLGEPTSIIKPSAGCTTTHPREDTPS